MASGTGGSWGRPPAQTVAPTESSAPAPTPQRRRDCGCG
uniref:Proline rich 29 n=1 Tax=Balaenoptera musculus TaxID=9771 RepID=A0A8C0E7F2_BALMU